MPEAQAGSAVLLIYRKPQAQQEGDKVVLNYNAGAEDPYFVPMYGESKGGWGKSRIAVLTVGSDMPKTGVLSAGPESPWGVSDILLGETETGWDAPGQYQATKDAVWGSTSSFDVPDESLPWGRSLRLVEAVKSVMDQNTPLVNFGDILIPWGKSRANQQSAELAWALTTWLKRRNELWAPWGISFPIRNEGLYPWDRKAPSHDIPWQIPYPSGPVTDVHGTIVVGVKKAYIMKNDITARTVADNVELPLQTVSLNIDYSTWAWGFSATLPASFLPYLQSSAMLSPIEVLVSVNGDDFLVIIEAVSRNRELGKAGLTISGRGHSAYLSSPYAAKRHFTNVIDMTCRQLFEDALTWNSASLGWTVNWMIPDWLVPAGAWDFNGNHIEAAAEIAGSVGAYILPDQRLKTLNVMSKYPTLPSEWLTDTPFMQLPSSVVQTEGIVWQEKPNYNGVYLVGGPVGGRIGRVVKDGTIGDYLAEQVEHNLLTHVDALREKGRSILADTGKMAAVTLSLPILDETGIILPGNVVRYVDGSKQRYGITRSISISSNGVSARQSIELEVHTHA